MKLSAYSVQLDLIPPDCVLFSFTIQKGTGYTWNNPMSMVDPSGLVPNGLGLTEGDTGGAEQLDSSGPGGCHPSLDSSCSPGDDEIGWSPTNNRVIPPYGNQGQFPNGFPNGNQGWGSGNSGGNGFLPALAGAGAGGFGGAVWGGGWAGVGLETIGGTVCVLSGVCEIGAGVVITAGAVVAVGAGAYILYRKRWPTSVQKKIDAANIKDHGGDYGCNCCGRPLRKIGNQKGQPTPDDQLQRHHKEPLSEGGPSTVENCDVLCPGCHGAAHQ